MTRARKPCPPIVVYKAMDEVSPAFMHIAKLFEPVRITNRETGEVRLDHRPLPIEFTGKTDEIVASAAARWWEAEQERLDRVEAKVAAVKPRKERPIAADPVVPETEDATPAPDALTGGLDATQ